MKNNLLVVAAMLFVAILFILLLKWKAKGGFSFLPPHEFAYGSPFKNSETISETIDQFLSLEVLDPHKIQIETYVGSNSVKNFNPLINYVTSQKNDALMPLINSLNEIEGISNQKEKAVRLVKALLPYKNLLRDESKRDYIIVFIYYGLKEPANLSSMARGQISGLVRQFDTAEEAENFNNGKCPRNYLVGSINIYPLALDNTSWHENIDFGTSKEAPILEIRFMGLKGIFKYLLNAVETKTGTSFQHLDGESI
jgi:hypothetical protein